MTESKKTSGGWRTEDWLAVGMGFLLLGAVLAGLRMEMPKFAWAAQSEFGTFLAKREVWIKKIEVLSSQATELKELEVAGSLDQLRTALPTGDRGKIGAAARQVLAAGKSTKSKSLQGACNDLASPIDARANAHLSGVFSAKNLKSSVLLLSLFLLISVPGVFWLGGRALAYVAGFPVVFALAWFSQVLAGNATLSDWGLEYVIFALVVGLVINHLFTLPGWLREAVRTEYYIKTGLVILGAGILFQEILQAGALGLGQAIVVVTVVWYFCFLLAKKLRVDDEFAVMLSSAVSICGVSAAIATCGAIQGDRKKLSYVTSLVLIVAVPMMIAMPWLVKHFNIPADVGGAWLGGTLDTSGSVVAAGALISERAMKIGVIVKFSQNVLIGVAAFVISLWWTFRNKTPGADRPKAAVIWERFPKFVLGFVAASLVFSFWLHPDLVKDTKKLLTGLRTFWFALAFVCIGLETRLSELVTMENGRPALAFIGAQAFNVVWTLILAYLLFGGILFPGLPP